MVYQTRAGIVLRPPPDLQGVGLVLWLLLVGGCVAIVGLGANEASKASSSEQRRTMRC